uniref:Uncharacterized protein n=1 Tax=Kalanchoe fedtschenkoi TaxID=63787 RepID=A0A7N0TCV9_KALFE
MVADKGKKQKVAAKKGATFRTEFQDQLEKINEQANNEVLEIEQKYNKPVHDKRKEVIQAIPDVWLTAFFNHPALSQLLTDEDQKIFKHLESVEVEESKDVKLGTVKVISTSIKWKEGMGIPNGANNEGKGNKRPLEEESFFSWEIIKEDLWPNPLSYFNNEGDEDFDGDEDDEEDKDDDDDSEDGDDDDQDEE